MTENLPTPHEGMSAAQIFLQRVSVTLAKAALSSIPFAALVFDIGNEAVDLANRRVQDRFLRDLAEKIQRLEGRSHESLKTDPLHEMAAHAAVRCLLTETTEAIASALARAVTELAARDMSRQQKAQCARIIAALSEPLLHGLQTTNRYVSNQLLSDEIAILTNGTDDRIKSGLILSQSMPLLSWAPIIDQLMQLGLLEMYLDAGVMGEPDFAVTVAPPTRLGLLMLDLCFSNKVEPALGRFSERKEEQA